MNVVVGRRPDSRSRPRAAAGLNRRAARFAVTALVIGGYMAAGFALELSAEAYLLLGIPITIAFQLVVVRRPIRSLWLRDAPALVFTPRSTLAALVIAIAPALVAIDGLRSGHASVAGWGVAGMAGAVAAIYALRAMDRTAIHATVRATVAGSAVLVGVMIAYRLATGGFHGNVGSALVTLGVSIATYLPVVFVIEEVLFRGLVDPYLRGSGPGPDRGSALFGSALWGIWHLPVASIGLGLVTIPYLVVVHVIIGSFLVTAWRRTGNLAAPGIAHAVADALRNAVAVL
jgi:membrane protease YdiL (CAAX protease family)